MCPVIRIITQCGQQDVQDICYFSLAFVNQLTQQIFSSTNQRKEHDQSPQHKHSSTFCVKIQVQLSASSSRAALPPTALVNLTCHLANLRQIFLKQGVGNMNYKLEVNYLVENLKKKIKTWLLLLYNFGLINLCHLIFMNWKRHHMSLQALCFNRMEHEYYCICPVHVH